MIRRVIGSASVLPLTVGEAKAHLRVEGNTDDPLIALMLKAACDYVETYTGRFLSRQTIEFDFAAFENILVLGTPLVSVTSIKYTDSLGAIQTVSPLVYSVILPGVKPETSGYVALKSGQVWPTGLLAGSVVTVRAILGAAQSSDVPPALLAAILLMLGDLYENRGAQSDLPLTPNVTISRLMAPWVVSWL